MKTTLLALTSAALLAGATAASAQSYGRYPAWDASPHDRFTRDDRDGDGRHDRWDRWDNLRRVSWDRDRDGMNDRYERRGMRDRDRDGVPNRYDRRDDRRHYATRRFDVAPYYAPRGYRAMQYGIGSRLPMGYYGERYYVDYGPYGLSAPPPGYRWNRVGNDAYLVAITNGVIRDVLYDLFY